jgi:cytochrome bd-type quinol oxidase subunit 2
MPKAQVPTQDRLSATAPDEGRSSPMAMPAEKEGKRHVSPFWRHFLEMFAAMVVGMIATGAIFIAVVGLKTWDEVATQYPTQSLLAIAAGMTLPMVAWMLYRGMGWKNAVEMAAVMILPVLPFLCLVWFGITQTAQCGAYCAVTVLAMLALMGYRRHEYSMEM